MVNQENLIPKIQRKVTFKEYASDKEKTFVKQKRHLLDREHRKKTPFGKRKAFATKKSTFLHKEKASARQRTCNLLGVSSIPFKQSK